MPLFTSIFLHEGAIMATEEEIREGVESALYSYGFPTLLTPNDTGAEEGRDQWAADEMPILLQILAKIFGLRVKQLELALSEAEDNAKLGDWSDEDGSMSLYLQRTDYTQPLFLIAPPDFLEPAEDPS